MHNEMLDKCSLRDLSENQIKGIPRKAFRGIIDVKNLNEVFSPMDITMYQTGHDNTHICKRKGCEFGEGYLVKVQQLKLILFRQLDNNQISCIEDGAFRALRDLEILTLNNNNITRIPVTSFNHMPKIRTLRLHSNFLHCDCHLAWLSDWLRQRRTIGQFTFCLAPVNLRGFLVAEVQKKDFVCSGNDANYSFIYQPMVLYYKTLYSHKNSERKIMMLGLNAIL
ncbi:hypothetical protein llap_14236 [Limosa lapponica baueri]|uniref:LRRCT domain-containing protein n=1 Tax=Limosa lapponica baueri TaxID=1758121 RepID=A0A2I0TNQ6_LIMLA|nr:hypothetical protein llap_14236 [Limosa lapponica baueri]